MSVRLTIVTALFNRLDLTRQFVRTLPASIPLEPGSWEAVLVDDGSSDGTPEFLDTLAPPFRALVPGGNGGFAAANNAGAAVARGEWLLLLNNDLVLRPGWFEPLWEERGNGPGVIGNVQLNAATGRVDHAGIVFNPWGIPEHFGQDYLFLPRAGVRNFRAVTAACCLVPRDLFDALGGFDEGFRNGFEDIDLCLRAGEAGGAVNRVVLGSQVGHHVSASPGRKAADGTNQGRFLARWGERTREWGLRDWPAHYLRRHARRPWRLNGRKAADAVARLLWRGRAPASPWMRRRAAELQATRGPAVGEPK